MRNRLLRKRECGEELRTNSAKDFQKAETVFALRTSVNGRSLRIDMRRSLGSSGGGFGEFSGFFSSDSMIG